MIEQTVSHYRIIKKLGAGGMGEVYLAKYTILDRKVAIKFLASESASDVNANHRLIREARSVATIACAYSVMNKPEQAIKWLQAAADDGFPCYPLFESDPYLDPLRQDSRFTTLMTGLKEQWKYYKTLS